MTERVARRSERRAPARRESMRDPFSTLRERMHRFLGEFPAGLDLWPSQWDIAPFEWRMGAFIPSVDIRDEDSQIRIEAELPGVSEKDVEVSLSPDSLIIKGEKKQETEEKEKGYYCEERSYGAFERAIPLPVDVDRENVQATFKNGVLNIILKKSPEAARQMKKIPVRAEEAKQ